MSDEERERGFGEAEPDEDAPPATPFDNPYFLPVVLFGLSVWFGYDGWFNEEMEWVKFNRYGFVFLAGAGIYFLATELTGRPFLLSILYVAYAAWLGYMGFLGSDDAWYADAQAFNRYGAVVCLVLAVFFALRERSRLERAAAASA